MKTKKNSNLCCKFLGNEKIIKIHKQMYKIDLI